MDADVVTLQLSASAYAPRAARHGVVDGMALHGELARDVALLVTEAVTNSVLHGGLVASDVVQVDACWAGDCLRVEVCDDGAGMQSVSPAGEREGGFGLNLIESIAQRWGVYSNGFTRVWFEVAGVRSPQVGLGVA